MNIFIQILSRIFGIIFLPVISIAVSMLCLAAYLFSKFDVAEYAANVMTLIETLE